jgi:hypothetical protein
MIAEHRVIIAADIDQVYRAWERAHAEAERAWMAADAATERAQTAEAHAAELHERYQRIRHQLGFMRVAAPASA